MVRDLCICDKHHNRADSLAADVGHDTDRRRGDVANVALATAGKLNCGVANDGNARFALNLKLGL